jgi:hypothetical protein
MVNKYEYEFVRLEPKGFLTRRPAEDYQIIIRDKAAEGWRLVTIVTPPSESQGTVGYYELIFERVARD